MLHVFHRVMNEIKPEYVLLKRACIPHYKKFFIVIRG
jgi:hypothetical protein